MDLLGHRSAHGGVAVLALSGEVDLATVPRAREHLVRLVTDHPGAVVVVDLRGVAFLDSIGLGVLVGAQRRARAAGGEIRLVLDDDRVRETLALSGLDAVFARYHDVESAAATDPVR